MTLVERTYQWRACEELLSGALRGNGGIGLITGPAGSGKTSLLQEFVERAGRAGCQVLTATGSHGEQEVPLGIVGQLLHRADLPESEAATVTDLLAEVALTWSTSPGDNSNPVAMHTLQRLCLPILRLGAAAPLVIVVDDMHLADRPSLQCLSYLARRVRHARVLLLLSEGTRRYWQDRFLRADLVRNPSCRQIPVRLLSPVGVEGVLRAASAVADASMVAECAAMTGGNPLLLRALIEDSEGHWAGGRPTPGDRFADAVADCLYRCQPTTSDVARALAVLGNGSTALLGQLLGRSAEEVGHELALLVDAGLVEDGSYRHPSLRAAVLAGIEPRELAPLHGAAARVLHGAGFPQGVVADHLLAADRVTEAWAAQTLCDEAVRALGEGDLDRTLNYLRAAQTPNDDEKYRATVAALLARTEWRRDPARALRCLHGLLTADGDLRSVVRCRMMAVHLLLWHGRPGEAIDAISALFDRDDLDEQAVTTVGMTILWLSSLFPAEANRLHRRWAALMRARPDLNTKTAQRQTVALLRRSASRGPDAKTIELARGLLDRSPITDGALPTLFTALSILIVAGRTDLAVGWCDRRLVEEPVSRTPTWRALILALRAEIMLRRGAVAEAHATARTALSTISLQGWGVALGGVLATLITGSTLAGDYAAAAGYLDVALPASTLTTPFGLKHLYARGTFYLATDQVQAAVRDFQSCGRMVKAWQYDVTGVVPWRLGLAQAYLKQGFRRQCREQANKQLRLLGDRYPEVRGAAMAVLAAVSAPEQRLALLEEAAELLMAGEDRVTTAWVCAELADALRAAGQLNRARMADRTARELAEQCGCRPLLERLNRADPEPVTNGARLASVDAYGSESLSDAERRVAALAASGYTNRAVADQLYITVSTVEQHLTRAYRKLGIRQRGELAAALDDRIDEGVNGASHAPVDV
ncbi:ATP-binding protein [Micromonospora sp. CA-240977]|uniref:ATP-binding protein n=1 Tax=Micromonospora sp. CA-240977 TaxID=3239957 RepID=UPI003D91F43C